MLGRAWRWIREQLAFLVVLGVLAAALIYLLAAPGQWRHGTTIVAASMLLAGLLRAVVPSGRVGMLVVRGRIVDTLAYLVLGGVILAAQIRLRS